MTHFDRAFELYAASEGNKTLEKLDERPSLGRANSLKELFEELIALGVNIDINDFAVIEYHIYEGGETERRAFPLLGYLTGENN